MELAPTSKVHTPQGYFRFLAEILVCSALETRILVLSRFIDKPCDSSEVFKTASLFLRSTKESLKISRSLAYNNYHRQLTLNSLDQPSVTIMNSKGLSTESWCITLKGSLDEPLTCTLDWDLLQLNAWPTHLLQAFLSSIIVPYKGLCQRSSQGLQKQHI